MKTNFLFVSNLIDNFKDENWKYLLNGLKTVEKLKHEQLAKLFNVTASTIVSWLGGTVDFYYKNKVKLIEHVFANNCNIPNLIKVGKEYYGSVRIGDERIPITHYLTKNNFSNKLIIKKGRDFYIHTPLLFPRDWKGKEIRFVPYKNKIIVFMANPVLDLFIL